jgi:molecular chaperone Hsp33
MNSPMTNPAIAIPSRAPAATTADDTVMPFEVATLDLRGRVVQLGPVVDQILERHAYPQPVAKLLGEAVVLAVMLGSALKIDGRFILQTQTDGPVGLLVVDFTTPGKVRACARYGKDGVAAAIASGKTDAGALLGKGHLAMTIDQGTDTSRYQGLVALDGGTLEDAAHEYFLRSEQIPTRVRLAVAEELVASEGGARHHWRAGGIMLQFLPTSPERARIADVELIDPDVSSERLVYRLFHEPGVRVFRCSEVRAECSCSRDSVEAMLKSFSQDDRDHMVEDGKISVTCEFCSANYVFAPGEVEAKAS